MDLGGGDGDRGKREGAEGAERQVEGLVDGLTEEGVGVVGGCLNHG